MLLKSRKGELQNGESRGTKEGNGDGEGEEDKMKEEKQRKRSKK